MVRELACGALLAAIVVAGPGVARAQGLPISAAQERVVRRVQAAYEAGFDSVLAAVAASPDREALWPLEALGRFKRRYVGWAILRDSSYFALDSTRARAWLAVAVPDAPLLEPVPRLLAFDRTATILVTRLKPVVVPPRWAGIYLVFELSILADYALGAIPGDPAREDLLLADFRAYNLEYWALRTLGGARLLATLDETLAVLHPASLDDLTARVQAAVADRLNDLSTLIDESPPEVIDERNRRGGVFVAALILRYGELQAIPDERLAHALARLSGY